MKSNPDKIDDGKEEAEAWNKHRYSQQIPILPPSSSGTGLVIHGKSLAEWASHLAMDDLKRIDTAIKTGLTGGLDNTEIARKVIGSLRLRGSDGATEITRRKIIRLAGMSRKTKESS